MVPRVAALKPVRDFTTRTPHLSHNLSVSNPPPVTNHHYALQQCNDHACGCTHTLTVSESVCVWVCAGAEAEATW